MRFLKAVSAMRQKMFGVNLKLVNEEFMGKKLTVYQGTIKTGDMDDAWLYALAQYHDSIYDIGSNIGFASIVASLNDPHKKIILVDPNPEALSCAAGSLMRSGMSLNKMFIPAFVSDKPGEKVKFYAMGVAAAGSMYNGHSETANYVNAFYWVDTLTLDKIYDTTGILPGLVKIDVEGAENLVMEGAAKLASLKKTSFFIEMHAPPEMPMKKNAELMLEWCGKTGYEAFYLKEHCRFSDADKIAHRGRCHILLQPSGLPYPEYLKNIKQGATIEDAARALK